MSTKYRLLAEQLKKDLSDNLKYGRYRLPTEQELCTRYHLSRQTVRQALLLLEEEGLIARRQGSGSYATGLLPDAEKNHVAILLSSDTEYIFPALLGDLETFLSKEGYSVSVFITNNRTDTERIMLQRLCEQPLRGLIAEPSRSALPTPNFDLYEKLSAAGTHIVFFHGYYSNLPPSLYVKDDNFNGGFMLGQFLIEQNHKKIAGIFQLDTIQGQERHLGFVRAMLEAGLPIDEDTTAWFTTGQLTRLEKKQDTRFLSDFISQNLSSCSAVICHNDEIAYWLIKELSYRDIRVPEDISIVSFDNSYLSELSAPGLTSLSHEPHEMASAAVSLLIQKMQGRSPSSMQLLWKLIGRGSCMRLPE
ncbi:MAG: substrate-binding domain-containing protein [Roseburia sp.]|nr:substrate-binding domain-containing protein [Roseburia sp.]MCM1241910.1 substrate-binding domain-containing protein [Roseburia sp.]